MEALLLVIVGVIVLVMLLKRVEPRRNTKRIGPFRISRLGYGWLKVTTPLWFKRNFVWWRK